MKSARPFIILLSLYLLVNISCVPASARDSFIPERTGKKAPDRINFKVPEVSRSTLDNGISLYVYPDHEIPLVTVRILIRTGSVFDFREKEGLADITGRLVRTGGVSGISADTVDEMLDQFAGALDVSVSTDATTATLSVLKDDLDKGLQLFSRMITAPAFEEKKLQITRNLKIEDLKRLPDDPFRLARREFNRQMYKDDPRGRYPSISSVKNIQRDDLIRFHKQHYHPRNAMIAVSGDITDADAFRTINKYFGAWPRSDAGASREEKRSINRGGIYFVKKDIPQSVILIGYKAPGKKDAPYFSFSVFDFIIGSGGFTSRIFQKVRSDQGLAYSTGSFYRADTGDGLFGVYAITKSSSTIATLRLLQSIIGDSQSKGVTAGEISWAKKSIDNGFIFSFVTSDQIAYQQMKIEYDKLPEDYLLTYREKMAAVTRGGIRKVLSKYIIEDDSTVMVLGNDEALRQVRSIYSKVKEIDLKE